MSKEEVGNSKKITLSKESKDSKGSKDNKHREMAEGEVEGEEEVIVIK